MKTVTTPNASKRYIVDSSGWVEYLGDGPKADAFTRFFEKEGALVLPTIIVYEVFKKLLRERGISLAERFFAQARQLAENTIVLDTDLAVQAARLSSETGLPMADAIIYATAQAVHAELITSDAHFSGLPGVTLI
jgi:predicted nucleic acid-binding protein